MEPALDNQREIVTTNKILVADADYIAFHMRERDWKEVLALWPTDVIREWAMAAIDSPGHKWTLLKGNEPVAFGGFTQYWPGVAHSWMVATKTISECGVALNRLLIELHRKLTDHGVHRFQCAHMGTDEHDDVAEWLKGLGYEPESVMLGYGKRGEDFTCYARVR